MEALHSSEKASTELDMTLSHELTELERLDLWGRNASAVAEQDTMLLSVPDQESNVLAGCREASLLLPAAVSGLAETAASLASAALLPHSAESIHTD